MNKGHLFSPRFELMGFSNIFYPPDHALFLLQLVTCKRLGVANGLWKENVLYLCRAMMSSAWLAAVVLTWDWFCWLMTSVHELALKSGKKGGHWTLFTHAHFQFTPTSYFYHPPMSSVWQFSLNISPPTMLRI